MDLFDEFERIINNSENYGPESRKEVLDKLKDTIDAMVNDNKKKQEDVLVPIKTLSSTQWKIIMLHTVN